ncbi:carbonic anhydrase [Bdellovibrio sp. SKB1291214]|uniref:carbonic anhydrase n=1 Tax=Bdellovibrio sp. SKB1291214 TaxID=1732569 RepID=UPI000B51C0E1|nr:carbonic anhydrase [Bdellovibrio sp. SKB1291214]UYL07805.1 carbonic anhydrase [Bdellovibrio sp. SKB1291214]
MTQESLLTKKEILKMMVGFRRFRERYFKEHNHSVYDALATGQSPKTLMIACSDSRVDPAILFSSSPGEIFVVRNVANLVPPFESNMGFHGVSAAIEFAVVNLQVENIVILGHRQCGGIRSLFQPEAVREGGFVQQWMTIAGQAKEKVLKAHPNADLDQHCRECEKTSIVTSIENLRTFPFIDFAIKSRGLQLIGVYFDLEGGQLSFYDDQTDAFRELEISKVQP